VSDVPRERAKCRAFADGERSAGRSQGERQVSERRTPMWTRLAAVALPLVLALLLVEVLVRVSGLSSTNHRMVYGGLVVKGRPGSSYVNRSENRNVVRLNNRGFHDRDWSACGEDYGILFLGDSMTEGIQVPVDSLFTSRLEDRLREAGMDVDVMNAAVSATGTGHQYLLWKVYIPESNARIDRIVLCLFPQNDLKNNHVDLGKGPESYGVYLAPDGTPWVHRDEPAAQTVARSITNHSALANLVYTRLHYLKTGRGPTDENVRAAGRAAEGERTAGKADGERASMERSPELAEVAADSLWADSMRRTLRLIGRWNDEANASGVGFSVAIIPSTDENNFYEDELVRRLVDADASGTLDVLALGLGGRSPLETNSFDGVTLGHLNYTGHRLAAGEFFDWLAPALRSGGRERGEGT